MWTAACRLADLLNARVRTRVWSIDDPRFTAVFLFSGIHRAIDDDGTTEKTIDRRLAKRVEEFCLRAVGPG
jgi:hypothetical protein